MTDAGLGRFSTQGWEDYELLDTGDSKRLERIGTKLIVRPEPHALWAPSLPGHSGWSHPHARYSDRSKGWDFQDDVLDKGWDISWQKARFHVKPTPFRHLGLFPEQEAQWEWLKNRIESAKKSGRVIRVLNLFAYTGAASIVAAQAGAEVCHVDAAKGSVFWASDNAKLSKVDEGIRWIVEDVRKFIKREARRGSKYDLIMLDPPVFGRGSKGEIWRLEVDLPDLLRTTSLLLSKDPLGFLLNFYATNLYPEGLLRLTQGYVGEIFPTLRLAEVGLEESRSKRFLQTGFCIYS